jgi:hypothetical protein
MSHEQFAEWCAKDMIEPIGSMQPVCEVLAKIGGMLAAYLGFEFKEADFMPWLKVSKQKSQQKLSPRQAITTITTHLRMLAGANNGVPR